MKKVVILISMMIYSFFSGCRTINKCELNNNQIDNLIESNGVWIYHIAGIQCEITYFSDIADVTFFLNSNDIIILDSYEISEPTCCACGCLSRLRFLVKINKYDLENAIELGWTVVNEKSMIDKYSLR